MFRNGHTRLQRSWRDFLQKTLYVVMALWAASFWLHIQDASAYYGLDPAYMTRVAKCESQLDPTVTSSNKLYHGGYQFSWRTWAFMSEKAGYAGASPYDPEAAAYSAAWGFAHGYASHWPRCRWV